MLKYADTTERKTAQIPMSSLRLANAAAHDSAMCLPESVLQESRKVSDAARSTSYTNRYRVAWLAYWFLVTWLHLRHASFWADLPVMLLLVFAMPSVCRHFAERDAKRAERHFLQDQHAEAAEARDAQFRGTRRMAKKVKNDGWGTGGDNPPHGWGCVHTDIRVENDKLRAELRMVQEKLHAVDKQWQARVEQEAYAKRRPMTPEEIRQAVEEYKRRVGTEVDPRIDLGFGRVSTHDKVNF